MPTSTASGQSKPKSSKRGGSKKAADGADKITNYASALRWLYSHADYERMRFVSYNPSTFNLARMQRLLEVMGNPHEQLKCVQIAGTKGKGSTCAMLGSMLRACGYTVGMFTSPHLVDLRERIEIDGQMVTHADLIELFKLIEANSEVFGDEQPSFFEILTASALRYFSDQAVDIVILETGLGGRLDCTSVVTPIVCGVAQISHDHMNILGKELTSIAQEKAGVFKKGVPAISVPQLPDVAEVLQKMADEKGTPLEFNGQQIDFSFRFEASRELGPHTRVNISTPTSRWEHLPVPLRGEHQAYNCGLALALLDKLKSHGFTIPEEQAIHGLSRTTLAGRMEQVWVDPHVVIDGAHNAVSIQALIRALGAHIPYDSLVLIFGCGQDKDIAGMLKQVSLGADKIIFTRAKANPRAVEPVDLMNQFTEISGKMSQITNNLEEALRLAGRAVSRDDLIVVTGSFYLVGEAKKHFADAKNRLKR